MAPLAAGTLDVVTLPLILAGGLTRHLREWDHVEVSPCRGEAPPGVTACPYHACSRSLLGHTHMAEHVTAQATAMSHLHLSGISRALPPSLSLSHWLQNTGRPGRLLSGATHTLGKAIRPTDVSNHNRTCDLSC